MSDLTKIFEITQVTKTGILTDEMFRVGIGVLVLITGVIGLILRRRSQGRFPKTLYAPVFMTGWGFLWLAISLITWGKGGADNDDLLAIYRSGKSEVAEGVVHVTHEQPRSGHDSGDQIAVGGKVFEIDYFLITPGYNRTIAHGGQLRGGVYAKLHHHKGIILKAEVQNLQNNP